MPNPSSLSLCFYPLLVAFHPHAPSAPRVSQSFHSTIFHGFKTCHPELDNFDIKFYNYGKISEKLVRILKKGRKRRRWELCKHSDTILLFSYKCLNQTRHKGEEILYLIFSWFKGYNSFSPCFHSFYFLGLRTIYESN